MIEAMMQEYNARHGGVGQFDVQSGSDQRGRLPLAGALQGARRVPVVGKVQEGTHMSALWPAEGV